MRKLKKATSRISHKKLTEKRAINTFLSFEKH